MQRYLSPGARRPARWLAVAVAVCGLGATAVAGMQLFGQRPRSDRFFGPLGQVQAGGSQPGAAASPAQAAERLRRPVRPEVPAAPQTLLPPTAGRVILGYGWTRSRVFGDWRFHAGVDLAGRRGQPVVAAAAGQVTQVRQDRLFGGVVVLELGGGLRCTYEGLGRIAVHAGERVTPGQTLGFIGPPPPAEAFEPPHVYWAVSRGGKPLDPERLDLG